MSQTRIILFSLGLLIVSALVSLVWNDCIGNDAAGYYVPMAELFAEGRYDLAFNSVIPPLVPLLAGIVTKVLPVSGFTGLKIVSALFMCLGMLPMYLLTRRLVPKEQAAWGCVLYAVCAQVIRFGVTAQLTSAKFFLVLCLIERCISVYEKLTLKKVVTMGVAMALLALCRTEGIFYLIFVFAAIMLAPFKMQVSTGERLKRVLLAGGVLIGTCLVIWTPWLVYEYRTTGYAVLDSRQMVIVDALRSVVGIGSAEQPGHPTEALPDEPANEPAREMYAQTLGEKLGETLDGLYIPYLPLVFIALISCKKQGRLGYLDTWLLCAAMYNILVIWAASTQGPPVLKRYIFPSALFLMPYAVLGWIALKAWLAETQSSTVQFWVTGVLCAVIVVSVADGLKQVTDSFRGKYVVDKTIGLWLKDHAHELDLHVTPANIPQGKAPGLHTGRSLVLSAAFPQIACWAEAQHVEIDRRTEKSMQTLISFCRSFEVDVLIVDKHVKKSTLGFDPNYPGLRPLNSSWADQGLTVYQIVAD